MGRAPMAELGPTDYRRRTLVAGTRTNDRETVRTTADNGIGRRSRTDYGQIARTTADNRTA